MKKETTLQYSSLINGIQKTPKDPQGEWKVRSPAHQEMYLGNCVYAYSQIDECVGAAFQNQKKWSDHRIEVRHALLMGAHQGIISKKEELIALAQNELGRTSQDLHLEFNQIEKWMEAFSLFKPISQEPRGVSAIISSYVSPLLHATHFVFLNLLAGNAVVLKPSEKSTLTVLKWAEIITQNLQLASVLQVLVGEKEVGRRLVCHEQVNTVIFMGSFEVGMRIKQDTLSQPAKEVLLFLGAKNAAILCEDYPETALQTVLQDSFLSTGQNCRSSSIVFVPKTKGIAFTKQFHELAKTFPIGLPEQGSFMGPFIDDAMLDRYLKFVGISEREGAEVLMRGKPLSLPERGYFATPTLVSFENLSPEQVKKSTSLQTEILSPHVSFIHYNDLEELQALHAQLNYGLCASIWGAKPEQMANIAHGLKVGEVVTNKSLLKSNFSHFFQARKKSGNHAYHGFKLYEQLTFLKKI